MGMAFRTTGFTLGNYEVGQTIGQGSSSEVTLGKHMETGELVALKIYSRGGLFLPQLKAEIAAFRAVRHPNVIRFLDILATSEKLYLVLEYASGGDLFSTIAALSGAMAEAQARKYVQQLISAVSYCHSQGVYHRDIKPENLLLDADGNLKIADFGLSACAEHKKNGLLYLRCGTNYYMAPEVIDSRGNNGVTPDLWFCGVVLFYIVTRSRIV